MDQKTRARKLRKALVERAASYGVKKVAVPMSSGVDSHCALFACLEAGLKPHVYSFHLEGVESRDVRIAQLTAKEFGLPFTKVTLPTGQKRLMKDVVKLAEFGCRSKTDFECFWPMYHLLPKIKEDVFFTGHGADSLYCLSRKACQHYAGREDEFRALAFSSNKAFQKGLIEKWCAENGGDLAYCPIFFTPKILKIFQGATPADLNKPIQKAVSRMAFEEYFERVRVYVHQPFQLGDTGIKAGFEEHLLESPLNTKGYKSVVGIYNELVRTHGPAVSEPDTGWDDE